MELAIVILELATAILSLAAALVCVIGAVVEFRAVTRTSRHMERRRH